MTVIDLLRKLGILRFGAVGAKYKSYKDMPDELMYGNVYNKKKDLMSKKDYKNIVKAVKGKGKKPSGIGPTVMGVVFSLVAVFFMICLLLVTGPKLLFFLGVLFWIVFFILFRKFTAGIVSMAAIIGIYVLTLFLTIVLILIGVPEKNTGAESAVNGNTQTDTKTVDTAPSNDCGLTDYTGKDTQYYTFKYPKCYKIEDIDTSVWVDSGNSSVSKDHIVMSFSSKSYPSTCRNYDTAGEMPLYAKQTSLSGLTSCERSVTKTQDNVKYTLVMWVVNGSSKTWSIVIWARNQDDLNVYTQIAKSLQLHE